MGERVVTTDLYESSYYLLGGCELEGIEAARLNGSICCSLTFRGERLAELEKEYFSGTATVPLFAFRRAFGQINALVWTAKKKARARLRQDERRLGGDT
jgi:hypothetical protein